MLKKNILIIIGTLVFIGIMVVIILALANKLPGQQSKKLCNMYSITGENCICSNNKPPPCYIDSELAAIYKTFTIDKKSNLFSSNIIQYSSGEFIYGYNIIPLMTEYNVYINTSSDFNLYSGPIELSGNTTYNIKLHSFSFILLNTNILFENPNININIYDSSYNLCKNINLPLLTTSSNNSSTNNIIYYYNASDCLILESNISFNTRITYLDNKPLPPNTVANFPYYITINFPTAFQTYLSTKNIIDISGLIACKAPLNMPASSSLIPTYVSNGTTLTNKTIPITTMKSINDLYTASDNSIYKIIPLSNKTNIISLFTPDESCDLNSGIFTLTKNKEYLFNINMCEFNVNISTNITNPKFIIDLYKVYTKTDNKEVINYVKISSKNYSINLNQIICGNNSIFKMSGNLNNFIYKVPEDTDSDKFCLVGQIYYNTKFYIFLFSDVYDIYISNLKCSMTLKQVN